MNTQDITAKKPTWFQAIDIANIAALLLGAGIIIILGATKANIWLMIGASLVLLLFVAIWIRSIVTRMEWLSRFLFIPAFGGFMIQLNGYVAHRTELTNVIIKTAEAWAAYFGESRVEKVLREKTIWVFFEPNLAEGSKFGFKAEGFTFARSHTMWVDFDMLLEPLVETAFEHELGHIIHGNITGNWDQDYHHEFSQKNGLK